MQRDRTLGGAASGATATPTATDRVLLDAVLALSSDLDVPSVLQRIVTSSCTVTGASRGALAVLGPHGAVEDLVGHGMSEDEVAAFLAHRQPRSGSRASGATLEVPVPVPGEGAGRLYLADKPGGVDFTEEDVSLVEALARGAGAMVGHARTYHRSERDRVWLAAAAEVAQQLQAGHGGWDSVAAAAARAGGADGAVVAQEGRSGYDVVAVQGEVPRLETLLAGAEELLRRADADGEVVAGETGDATVLAVPLQVRLADRSVLLLSWARGQRRPDAAETSRIAGFAESAALALDRTQGLAEREELLLVADRDRIARDLHDLVIQRLFATGLQLQGVHQMTTSEAVRRRVDEAVGDLDQTIRDIRSTIFGLQRRSGTSLRADLQGLVREYAPILGFTPQLRTAGPVDHGLPGDLGDHVLATLREALSNVCRHARAGNCVVEVSVDQGWVRLVVTDDGVGVPAEPEESGLRNARRRASEQGGQVRLLRGDPRGTRLEWSVPVDPGAARAPV